MNEERYPTLKRFGRWSLRAARRIAVAVLVLFVLAAIPWTYFNIKWGRELEAKLAELKAQGMPLTMAEAAPKDVPDAQNAAVLYQKVFKVQFLPAVPVSSEGSMGGLSDEEQELFGSYLHEPTPELESQVGTLLARPQVQQALDTLRRGSQRPYCVFQVNWDGCQLAHGAGELFPHLVKFRRASQMLAVQAVLLADEGRVDEALDWCAASLRMSEHAASEPTLVSTLVDIALQAITHDAVEKVVCARSVRPASAQRLEKYLSEIDARETYAAAMEGEMAYRREMFDALDRRPEKIYELATTDRHRPTSALQDMLIWLYCTRLSQPLHKLDQLAYLDNIGRQIEVTGRPYREAGPKMNALGQELAMKPSYLVVTRLLTYVFPRALAMQKRDHIGAIIGLCHVALALKAYKYEHGAYPQSLEQLQETLDWHLPEDPFSGKDFVYHRQGEGFIAYSLGPDLDDDGGQPLDMSSPSYNGDRQDFDIVWACSR